MPTRRTPPILALLPLALALGAAAPARAQSASAARVDPAYFAGMRWRSIGPYRAGNVYAVAGIPGDPATYYIGTPEGGVWKTSDGGTVWKPVFDNEHVPSIGAVAVSASDPNVVYVGTGDPSGWSFTPGNGVYRSDDAGRTWRNVGLDGTRYINAVLVDPHNPDLVLVGALGSRQFGGGANDARGIYRSTNGGRTWTRVLYRDAFTGVADMTADAADPRIAYAAFQRGAFGAAPAQLKPLAPLGNGIYRSTDEGATWTPVAGHGLPPGARFFEIAVASGTGGRRLYAEAQGTGRDASGVYRSDDAGATWHLGTHEIGSAGGHIYVDPKNPDVVYLMGTSMYRSLDGAHTFVSYKGAPGGDDDRDLWIDPANPRRMLMGVDQGPTITVDGGATWTPWFNLPNGQFYHVSTDNGFPYRVCGAQQDSGTGCVLSRSDYGEIRDNDWYPVGGFEDGYIVTDPLDARWIYTQGWYHVLRRYDRVTGQVSVLYTPAPADHFGAAPPLAFSPQDPHALYMGAQYVLVSNDSARTWRHMSPDLTAHGGAAVATSPFSRFQPSIQTLAPSPVAAGEIWAGTSNGVIQVTRDNGGSWTDVTPKGIPVRGAVNIIDPSHHDAGTAYAAVNAFGDDHPYIYRTTDFGRDWQPIAAGLPQDAAVRVVREDPVDPDLLYAGTVTGAWVSFDRGDHWQSLQLNLPNTVISDMTAHGNDLAISTYGRALWILDDVTPLRETARVMAARSAYLFPPEPAYRVRWDNDQDTPLPPEVPAGQNPPEGAIIDYYLKSAATSPVTLTVLDAKGHLVQRFSSATPAPDTSPPNVPMYWFRPPVVLATTPGMHRIAWDLRYPDPSALNYSYFGNLLDYTEYTLTSDAILGQTPRVQPRGPLVIPGRYQVRLTVGGRTYTRELAVTNDPRVPITQEALAAQLAFEQRIIAGMATSYDMFNQLARLRAVLATDRVRAATAGGAAQLLASLRSVDSTAARLANGAGSSFGLANRDLTRHLEDMEFGDLAPTPSDIAAVDENCREITSALAGLRTLQGNTLPVLASELARARLGSLPALAAPARACGM